MQLQHISEELPNSIAITKIREDIDALTDLLEKFSQVHVLRGQDILFEAVRPETEQEKNERMKQAIEVMKRVRKSTKIRKRFGSEYIINERNRIIAGKGL